MLSFVEVFIIFVMILIMFMFIKNKYSEVEYFKSDIDARFYLVRKLPDMDQAADFLANINMDLIKLVRHMIAKYPNNKDVVQLYNNYNPTAVSEGSPDSGYTSYSINKGEKIVLCIRQKNKSFVDKNVVMYVAIHELAHAMTSEIGHTALFWNNFKLLLENAIEINIYTKQDFNNTPEEYCGIQINNSII